MGAFKRFADFCGGIALFSACFFLLREFIPYAPNTDVALREKWRLFLLEHAWRDYRPYLGLIGLLALSLFVGIVCRRLPSLCFAVATLPFLQAMFMLYDGRFYERPMLYVLLTALPLAGNLFDALHRDSLDGRHRAFILANVSSALALGFFVLLLWRMRATADTHNIYEQSRFDQAILLATDAAPTLWKTYAALYAASITVSLLFRGAYWLDALLALIPVLLALRRQILGTLGPHGVLILSLMILCLICRVALVSAGVVWKEKR